MRLATRLEIDSNGREWKVTRLPYQGPDTSRAATKIVRTSDHIRKRQAAAKMRRRAMRGAPVE